MADGTVRHANAVQAEQQEDDLTPALRRAIGTRNLAGAVHAGHLRYVIAPGKAMR